MKKKNVGRKGKKSQETTTTNISPDERRQGWVDLWEGRENSWVIKENKKGEEEKEKKWTWEGGKMNRDVCDVALEKSTAQSKIEWDKGPRGCEVKLEKKNLSSREFRGLEI